MPNTLAHLAFQGSVTHGLLRTADVRWVALGCIIPDLPWVLNRVVRVVAPAVSLYDLRAYAIVQSSLLFGILLAGALASVAERSRRVFLILFLGVILHLALDAVQTKWANGVLLLAPFSWQLFQIDLFWPEHPLSYALTVGGLLYIGWGWKHRKAHRVSLRFDLTGKRLLAVGLVAVYFLLPVFLRGGPEAADAHSLGTLRDESSRVGKYVEFDRNPYVHREDGAAVLTTFAQQEIVLTGDVPSASGTLSVRGRFTTSDTVQVIELHEHAPWIRDLASYLGLLFVAVLWLATPRLAPTTPPSPPSPTQSSEPRHRRD